MTKRRFKTTIKKALYNVLGCGRWAPKQTDPWRKYALRLKTIEKVRAQQNDCDSTAMAKSRMWAHSLDKSLHREDYQIGRAVAIRQLIEENRDIIERSNCPTSEWIKTIAHEYDKRLSSRHATHQPLYDPYNGAARKKHDAQRVETLMVDSRSTRIYEERHVSAGDLYRLAYAASMAANSSNRQTLQIFGTSIPELAHSALANFRGFTNWSHFVPAMLVFGADLRSYSMPKELFNPAIDTSLAAQNAALLASALGMSMTFLSWANRTEYAEKALREILRIPNHCELFVGAAIGYPKRHAIKPVRRNRADVLTLLDDSVAGFDSPSAGVC